MKWVEFEYAGVIEYMNDSEAVESTETHSVYKNGELFSLLKTENGKWFIYATDFTSADDALAVMQALSN